MVTPSPIPFLDALFDRVTSSLPPPPWLVGEAQQRLVLLLNHVLMQEPEAMARLARQKGQVASVQWRSFAIHFEVTPAGLLDLAPASTAPALRLELTQESPTALAQGALRGDKPAVRIEGDVQLAAELNWVADHVRWDLEEDLSRLLGDGPAHALVKAVKTAAGALRQFVARFPATSIVRDQDGRA